MGVHTINDLRQFQAMPLPVKIAMTKLRIRDWVNEFGVDGVYVSFSGGKDSTVLLHLVREEYPDVPAVFVDTGLEYPEIREFVKTFDNVIWLKPKMNFRQVIDKYGYPMISKEVCECVYGAKKYFNNLLDEDDGRYRSLHDELCKHGKMSDDTISKCDELANLLNERKRERKGGRNQGLALLLGWLTKDGQIKANISDRKKNLSNYSQEKYKFFLFAPFDISNKCCNVMKKEPVHRYSKETGRKPMLAVMADESRIRTQKWLQHGCNMFDLKYPVSNPMSFWTEQDILRYIKEKNIPICSVYGDIVTEDGDQFQGQMDLADFGLTKEVRKLKTTKCSRTGCMFCGFGCHLEKNPNRFELLKQSHPQIYDYIMRSKEKGGLNYKEILDWINEYGNLNIKY